MTINKENIEKLAVIGGVAFVAWLLLHRQAIHATAPASTTPAITQPQSPNAALGGLPANPVYYFGGNNPWSGLTGIGSQQYLPLFGFVGFANG